MSSSIGMMTFPTYGKIKFMASKPPTRCLFPCWFNHPKMGDPQIYQVVFCTPHAGDCSPSIHKSWKLQALALWSPCLLSARSENRAHENDGEYLEYMALTIKYRDSMGGFYVFFLLLTLNMFPACHKGVAQKRF